MWTELWILGGREIVATAFSSSSAGDWPRGVHLQYCREIREIHLQKRNSPAIGKFTCNREIDLQYVHMQYGNLPAIGKFTFNRENDLQ